MDPHDPLVVNLRAQPFLSSGGGGPGLGVGGQHVVSLPALSALAGRARGLEEVTGAGPPPGLTLSAEEVGSKPSWRAA